MNNKFYFLKCICVIISLSIFSSCNSNSDKVKEMEKIIMWQYTHECNPEEQAFFSNINYYTDLCTSNFIKLEEDAPEGMFFGSYHLDSITYMGYNWFKISGKHKYEEGEYHENHFTDYIKMVEEDNKIKFDDINNVYSECITQIKDLPYTDRIKFWFNSIKYDDVQHYFQGNICKVSNDNKIGFINLEGEEIIPCKYDDAKFGFGWSRDLINLKLDNKHGLFNLAGEEIIPCKYNNIKFIDDCLLQVKLDDGYGLINIEGEEIIPCKYDDFIRFNLCNKNLFQVKSDNKYGLIDFEGKEFIPCKYDDLIKIFDWWNDSYLVKLDNKYGLINSEGKEFISCKYDDLIKIFDWWNDSYLVKLDNKYGLINSEGKEIIPCSFDHIDPLEDDQMLKVRRENLWGYYMLDGTQVTDFYEDIEYYYKDANYSVCNLDHPIFAAKSNGKWGYLDESGDTLIEFELDYAGTPYNDGTAYVEYNGQYGKIDLYTGYFYRENNNSNSYNNSISQKICPECSGTGKMAVRGGGIVIGTQGCPVCGGNGYILVPSWGW